MSSVRVASNVGHGMQRQLPKAFSGGTKAVFTDPPTKRDDAMGVMDASCMLSFSHDSGTQRNLTFYHWSEMRNKWLRLGPVAAVYTLACDPDSTGTITAEENMLIFVQADTAIDNFWLGGARRYDGTAHVKDLKP